MVTNLSMKQKELIVGLQELGVSVKVVALMMTLLQTEEEYLELSRYIQTKGDYIMEQVAKKTWNADSFLLEYLMGTMKGIVIDEE